MSSSALVTSIIFMSASRVSTLKNSSLQFIGLCMVRTGSARPRPGRPDYIQYLVKLPKINHSSNVENINNLLVSNQALERSPATVHRQSGEPLISLKMQYCELTVVSLIYNGIRSARVWRTGRPSPKKTG